MFIDKAAFLDIIRDYMVQEGIYMRYLKNDHVDTLETVRARNVTGEYMPLSRLME